MSKYIDLDRQFLPFQDEETWEAEYYEIRSGEFHNCEKWPQLLKHKRSVILAEAGAGKTVEMRERAKLLSKEGSAAFYVTVRKLAKMPLRQALESQLDQKSLDAWMEDAEEGFFFVDSIDDARLYGEHFRDALINLSTALSGSASRATILISCRVSDWRATQDRIDLEELIGRPPDIRPPTSTIAQQANDEALYEPLFSESEEADDENESDSEHYDFAPHITALAPLNSKQAKQIAELSGVSDVDKFIAAINEADADDLANRPLDLLNLAGLWKEKGAIGSKYEVLKWSIKQRLRESNIDIRHHDQLPEDKALEGAKLVAAALTFSRLHTISWPLEPPQHRSGERSLNPQDALADWNGKEQATLLNRAVFDPATLGRVRFHHRSVQELLCAEWLLDLKKAGCSVRKIWSLLAEIKYGAVRIRPSLRPVSAWLAQLDESFFSLVMQIAPELLIEGGDPSVLTRKQREAVLNHFAIMYRGRDDGGIGISIQQVSRIADPTLSNRIKVLWSQSANSGEVRELLLRIIWRGRISACRDIALAAAKGRQGYYERALGARILEEIGTSKQRRELAKHLIKTARSFPKKAIEAALGAVFPSAMNLSELESIICKHPKDNLKSIHAGISYGLSEISKKPAFRDHHGLVQLLHTLASKKPLVDKKHRPYSQRFSELRAPLANACAQAVISASEAPVSYEIAKAARFIALTCSYTQEFQINEARKHLTDAISRNVGAKRQQFWLAVEDYRTTKGKLDKYLYLRAFHEFWMIQNTDFGWLIADVTEKKLIDDKLIALGAVYEAWLNGDKPTHQKQEIETVISRSEKLDNRWKQLLKPPATKKSKEEIEFDKRKAEIESQQKQDKLKIQQNWREFRDGLTNNLQSLKHGSASNELYWLAFWIGHKDGKHKYSLNDWRTLNKAFSPKVAQAARDGFVNYWRTFDPGTESARSNKTPYMVRPAMIGISIEHKETKNFIKNCSTKDVEVATRLALYEMNSFPDWAIDLWSAHWNVARPILRDELCWEYNRPTKDGVTIHVATRFLNAKEPVLTYAAELVLEQLETKPVRHPFLLSFSLDTIVGAKPQFRSRLSALASSRFSSERSVELRLTWLSLWFGTDSASAIDQLEQWLSKQQSKARRVGLVVRLLCIMFDHGMYRFGKHYRDFCQFDSLYRFLRIVYTYIRTDEDNSHEGVYTPDARDQSRQARSHLLGLLFEIPGRATYDALLSLGEIPGNKIAIERFHVLSDERASLDADLKVIGVDEVLAMRDQFEKPPKTLEELHEVILHCLWEIEDHICSGRFSNKKLLRQDHENRAQERPVQLAIAKELQMRSNNIYSVEREPELESFDEPDVSIQCSGISEPLPVEIKVADSWSYTQLCEAISGQLVKKYMRPRAATNGHLVITYHGKKKFWQPGGDQLRLTFTELIPSLQAYADSVADEDSEVTKISVTGIDLTASKD